MTKLELAFQRELETRLAMNIIAGWMFQPLKLKLARRTFYTPDFLVLATDGSIEIMETKGSWKAPHQEDGRVKIKVAACIFKFWRFYGVTKEPQRKGGQWLFERISSSPECSGRLNPR